MAAAEQVVGIDREGRPSPIDVHVGTRIRLRRTLLGMSQERLGEALGVDADHFREYRLRAITERLEAMPEMIDRLFRKLHD